MIRRPPISPLFPYPPLSRSRPRRITLRTISPPRLGISLDEATSLGDLADLVAAFSLNEVLPFMVEDLGAKADTAIPERLRRTSDRKSTRLNSSHSQISYAVFCLKKKKQ